MTGPLSPGDLVTIDPAHPRWSDPQLAVLWSDMRLTVEGEPGALFVDGRKGARHMLAADGRCGFVRVAAAGPMNLAGIGGATWPEPPNEDLFGRHLPVELRAAWWECWHGLFNTGRLTSNQASVWAWRIVHATEMAE